MNAILKLALFALVAAVGYLGLAYALQRTVLFPRPPHPTRSPADGRADVETTWLGSERNVEAWLLAPTRGGDGPFPVLVFSHGNGELIDYWLDEFAVVREWGMGVLLVEYPGYGRSRGNPSEASIARIMAHAHEYLISRPDVDAGRIVAHGRSVGGGAAATLVREKPVAAVVLESSFTSVRRMARRHGLFGPLVRDPFEVLGAVESFTGPVLVIHGRNDRLIPPSHGRELAEGARDGTLVLMDCGHNDCPRPWAEVRAFLERNGIL